MSDQSKVDEFGVETVRAALREVLDPEIGINIVDIGLIYRIEVGAGKVEVDMTMTSPACPMGDMLLEDVESAMQRCMPEGYVLELQLVWEPPWSPALMSEDARSHFGWDI